MCTDNEISIKELCVANRDDFIFINSSGNEAIKYGVEYYVESFLPPVIIIGPILLLSYKDALILKKYLLANKVFIKNLTR